MPIPPVKVVIEICGGVVVSVYAGNAAQEMIDVFIVDHDSAEACNMVHQPLMDFHPADVASFKRGKRLQEWMKS